MTPMADRKRASLRLGSSATTCNNLKIDSTYGVKISARYRQETEGGSRGFG